MFNTFLPAIVTSASVLITGLYLMRLAKKQNEKKLARKPVPVPVRKEEDR